MLKLPVFPRVKSLSTHCTREHRQTANRGSVDLPRRNVSTSSIAFFLSSIYFLMLKNLTLIARRTYALNLKSCANARTLSLISSLRNTSAHRHFTTVDHPKRMLRRRKDLQSLEAAMRGNSPHEQPSKRRSSSTSKKELAPASPSASILLISPANHILLLHRVSSSSAFASAHVFPGGHCSPQDGHLPPPSDPSHHEDSPAYRHAAIRECFEESGILLARKRGNTEQLVELAERERDEGRKAVHAEKVLFEDWVKQKGGEMDTQGLVPFTRWLTPANIPKRYSTQMYLYFLPLESGLGLGKQTHQIHIATPDGGVEHTAAKFAWAGEWVEAALRGECVLFPPQFFLLSLVGDFLKPPSDGNGELDTEQLREQRRQMMEFVRGGDPPWGEKCISPNSIKQSGDTLWMGLGDAGPELAGTARSGEKERVLRIELSGEVERGRRTPRPKEVVMRKDLGARKRAANGSL